MSLVFPLCTIKTKTPGRAGAPACGTPSTTLAFGPTANVREVAITQLTKRIGSRLFEMRQAAQLSQERLAAAAELSTNYISLIEKGLRLPSLEALSQLARVLDVSVTAFLEEEAPEGTLERELCRLTAYLRRRQPEEVRKLRAIARILFAD